MSDAADFFSALEIDATGQKIADEVLKGDPRPAGLLDQRRASTTCRSTARRRRSPAANRSASAWPGRSAAAWSACCTSSTSPRSACTRATTTAARHARAAPRHGQHGDRRRARRRHDARGRSRRRFRPRPRRARRRSRRRRRPRRRSIEANAAKPDRAYLSASRRSQVPEHSAARSTRRPNACGSIGATAQQPQEHRRRDSAGPVRLRHRRQRARARARWSTTSSATPWPAT